jgi:SPRY domain
MVDMDEHIVSFTLNGRGEEIGMGVAFSGQGFRPCGGVYACVSFNRREKLRINLGGRGNAPFKHPPPEGYKGVGEAVLAAVEEREDLVSKECVLNEKQDDPPSFRRYLCDFSDGEHGFELMSHSHRYYGSDASVHLGSGRIKQTGSTSQSSAASQSPDSISWQCLARRIKEEWNKSGEPPSGGPEETVGNAEIKSHLMTEMNIGLQSVAVKLCLQGVQESLILSSLVARKLLLHVMVASEDSFDPAFILESGENEQASALRFWKMIEACTSLRSAGWVGEAGAMAIAAEALGLGISSVDTSSSRLSEDRSGFVSLSGIDEGFVLSAGGIDQVLSSVLDPSVEEGERSLGTTLAASAEAAIGSNAGQGILIFLLESLRAALSKSQILKLIAVAAVRRSVRQLAVVEYETEDSTRAESTESEDDTKRSTKEKTRTENESRPQPDARLASFFTGLLITCADDVHQSLFEAWSVGMLSASVPWRMICAFTAAGILEQRPDVFPSVLKFPTLARFFARLRDTVARRVWAERAATPVASRYVQAMVQLLCSVNHALDIVDDSNLPSEFLQRLNRVEVDAATPLPLPQSDGFSSDEDWEVGDGWISSDRGWELWTGTIERSPVDWKTPSRSAVRTLMEGGEGPPMLREGCTVLRGPDWNVGVYGNADGKDVYEAEKAKREEEKTNSQPANPAEEEEEEEVTSENAGETNHPTTSDHENQEQDGSPNPATEPLDEPFLDPDTNAESLGDNPAEDPLQGPVEDTDNDPSSHVPEGGANEQTNQSSEEAAAKKKKKRVPNPKLPTGVVVCIEAWEGIPAMACRVRWNLTGEEGLYRFGAEGRFDISHVEVNQKSTKVRKRHPLPESAEQCMARHGFGLAKTSTILLRLRQTTKELTDDNGTTVLCRKGIMEYPEFSAGILVDCQIKPDGTVRLQEKDLLYGSKDSGWEARFGTPNYVPGTVVLLKPSANGETQADVDTKSPHGSLFERLSGTTSHNVPRLRNRDGGGKLQVESTFRIVRSRSTPILSDGDIPKHLIEAPIPGMQFDRSYHASSLSVSRDGRTLSCVSSDGRGTAFANVGFSKGVHYWEVKLESCDIGSVFIGVAEKPPAGTSGSSCAYDTPPRLNRWHGFGFVNFRATYTSGAERIYGAHCHAGDTIGVLLDCDGGRLSFFYDGMKYGEHILNDLGVAFENLSPFGFNCDGWYVLRFDFVRFHVF